MLIKILTAATLTLCLSAYAQASSSILIIGGGPYPKESQASIEINTKWIIDVLKQHAAGEISRILYTDGNAPGVDVYRIGGNDPKLASYEPLARVYGKEADNSHEFYSSRIAQNSGAATYESVVAVFKSTFAALKDKDEVFIVFQGHGGYSAKNPNNNFLRLWNDGKLTVTELGKLMTGAPQTATLRFLFPQCHSGAFTNLMYQGQSYKNRLTQTNICGFTAQRQDLGSEGCTPSIETKSYRDYSSYLFSAVNGKTIDGAPLSADPDMNHDGSVSLREAHLYALTHAFSVDYSRATSEDYLENWLPWYLKLTPDTSEPENVYMTIASTIAAKYELPGNGATLLANMATRMRALESVLDDNKKTRDELSKSINQAQQTIRQELSKHWPQLDAPYTAKYNGIVPDALAAIVAFIKQQPPYPALAANQHKLAELTASDLNTRRELVQLLKVLRMRKLGRTLALFNQYATAEEKTEYMRLVSCEDARL